MSKRPTVGKVKPGITLYEENNTDDAFTMNAIIINLAPGAGKSALLKKLETHLSDGYAIVDGDDLARTTPPSNFVGWIKKGFELNQFYIVQKDDYDIGCFRLQWEDPMYWGEQDDNAGYIHSFRVSRDLVGKGTRSSDLPKSGDMSEEFTGHSHLKTFA